MHLSPDHVSHLAEVLQTATKLPVTQVIGAYAIEPNHVYVIPPNSNLKMDDGHLEVSPMNSSDQRLAPMDFFFRALAEENGEGAVAVVLSGTGQRRRERHQTCQGARRARGRAGTRGS